MPKWTKEDAARFVDALVALNNKEIAALKAELANEYRRGYEAAEDDIFAIIYEQELADRAAADSKEES